MAEYLPDDLPVRDFKTRAAWRTWLAKNHGKNDGVWIRFAKKASGEKSVSYQEAVEVALCYGWIDGKVRTEDDRFYIQRYTPRRPKSPWSKINREKAEGLIATGEMQRAGLEAIEAAKADGRWDAAYSTPEVIEVPPDLARALPPKARAFFDGLSRSNRFAIVSHIEQAKRPETRARRIAHHAARLKDGLRPFE